MAETEDGTGGVAEQAEQGPSVASTARRLLKDSGRYLLAGVKAALAGAQTPATFVIDAWRQGHNELRLDRVSLSQLLNVCLARQTAGCAEKGVDLLLEHGEPLPEARFDGARIEAVLEIMLDTARQSSANNRAMRVRSTVDGNLAVVTVYSDIEGESPAMAEGSSLWTVREMARAHGGELVAERVDAGPLALRLTLPLSDVLGLG
jgi:hypothetical protein